MKKESDLGRAVLLVPESLNKASWEQTAVRIKPSAVPAAAPHADTAAHGIGGGLVHLAERRCAGRLIPLGPRLYAARPRLSR